MFIFYLRDFGRSYKVRAPQEVKVQLCERDVTSCFVKSTERNVFLFLLPTHTQGRKRCTDTLPARVEGLRVGLGHIQGLQNTYIELESDLRDICVRTRR